MKRTGSTFLESDAVVNRHENQWVPESQARLQQVGIELRRWLIE